MKKKYLSLNGLVTLVKKILGLHVELTYAEYQQLVADDKDKPYVEYFITDRGYEAESIIDDTTASTNKTYSSINIESKLSDITQFADSEEYLEDAVKNNINTWLPKENSSKIVNIVCRGSEYQLLCNKKDSNNWSCLANGIDVRWQIQCKDGVRTVNELTASHLYQHSVVIRGSDKNGDDFWFYMPPFYTTSADKIQSKKITEGSSSADINEFNGMITKLPNGALGTDSDFNTYTSMSKYNDCLIGHYYSDAAGMTKNIWDSGNWSLIESLEIAENTVNQIF